MQLTPQELRIGNYLHDAKGRLCRVEEIMKTEFRAYAINGAITTLPNKPILLTEEILLKCGFEKYDENEYDDIMYQYEMFALFKSKSETKEDYVYPLLMRYGNPREYKHGIGILYLHQLQNLYFASRGEELKITL